MKKNYKKNNYNKIQKFSIRKYSFGAASVAIASYLMFMGNGAVFAGEATVTENTAAKTEEVVTTVETKKEETPKVVETAEEKAQKKLVASKEKLANYVKEIEGNLSSGKYESKTEESLALLRDAITEAKQAANATTTTEVEKAYAKLITTVNAKLKAKPVEKKETPAVDTTNGKETVGKKAENTEKKSESNSIENTGSNDPRNGKALDKNNAFRAEIAYKVDSTGNDYGKKDSVITSGIGASSNSVDALNAVNSVMKYRAHYNTDSTGKITSVDWQVFFNDHLQNFANDYKVKNEVFRNYIQIPNEVNMPTDIRRLQYKAEMKFANGKYRLVGGDGTALSDTVSFANPTPATAAGRALAKNENLKINGSWDNYTRGLDTLYNNTSFYYKDAVKDALPDTKKLLNSNALPGKRVIYDNANTGGDQRDGYVWEFTTTVPNTVTNEQLKNMKVSMGMVSVGTAGVDHGFHRIAENPVNLSKSDVTPPTVKTQTVKVGEQPKAENSIANFKDLPAGTTAKFKEPVNTATPGEKTATAVVTYSDGSKVEGPVKVIVEKEAVAPAKPVITTILTGKANTKTPVEVKAEAGSTVSLFAKDGTKLGTAVANAQGVASITPTVNIPAGIVAATATKDGKTSEVSDPVEATPAAVTPQPETPKPSTPAPGAATNKPAADAATSGPEIVNDLAGKASTPADVTVKAPAGSTVKLYNTDGVVIGEAVANAQGVATIHPTNSLPAGEITATSTPAGGKESAKSTPITVTKTPTPIENIPKTTIPHYQLQMMTNATKVTLYRGDDLSLTGAAAGTALRYFGITKETAFNVEGVKPSGGLATNGTEEVQHSEAKAEGTVSWNQPLGDKTITFRVIGSPDPTSKDTATIDRHIIVTVLEVAKKYEPVAGTKLDVANSNNLSEDDKNKVIASVKAANPSLPADSQYSVDEKGNLTITYPDGSKDKIAAAYLVNPATPAAPVVAPTVEIPYSNKDTKEVYVYAGEENSFDIKFKDDSGKIASATVKQGGNRAFDDVAGEANTINTQYGFKANVINAETPATAEAPAVITYSGTPAATDGLAKDKLEAATKGENPEGMALGWRYATATDKDGAFIENKAVGSSTATDPGAFRVMLKGQTQKYDIATPTEKVTVADPANVTDADLAKIKEKLQLEYSQNNDDANLADKKGQAVADKDAKIKSIEKDADGNLVVTYKDGSQDKKPLSEFVTKETTAVAPTVEIPYSNKDTKEVYVYAGEENSFDIKFKDDSGKIASATVRQGGNKAFADVAGEANTINTQYGFKANVINAETPATEKAPAVITYSGTPAATDGLAKDKLEAATKGENPEGMPLGWRYATATDTDGAFIENKAVGSSTATDPGAFRVMLKGQTQKYDIATPTEKVTVADPANVTDADLAKIKEKLQLEYSQNNDDANLADKKGTPVADKDAKIKSIGKDADGNLVLTYKDGSQDKKPLSEFVTKKPTDADKNTPKAKLQIVDKGTTPKAEDSIGNVKDLPKGTKVAFKDPVDTATPGKKDATVVVTYPDGSKEEVPVKVTVKDPSSALTDADKNTPTGKPQTVNKGTTPKAEDSIENVKDLPKGTKVAFKDPVDTATPGEKDATLVVTYPDGSKEEVPVKVTVKDPSSAPTDADKNTPTGKPQTVNKGTTPKAEDSIGNVKDLPKGTKVAFKDPVDTATPGEKDATVVVTYPDGSKEEVPVKVTVKDPSSAPTNADKNTPTGKPQTVNKGTTPKAEDSIGNVKDLPKGTKVAFKDPVDTATPGEKDATVVVTYPDGSKEEVPVKVTVKDPSSTPDTKAPAKPEIKTDLTDKAGTKTPVEVSAEPGSKVELFDKEGNKIGEGVADENGKATITPTVELPAGDVTAKATDPAGNVSEPSAPEKATADTKAPAKPEIKTDLTDKAGTKTPVEVSAEPGSKVELFDKEGNKIGEGVADENGKATITPTVELPAGDVTAKATDPAGNVSEPSAPEKATADTKAPAKPEIKTDLTDKAGTKTPVEVSAEPGSKVELFDKEGNKIGEGVADENGKATITPTVELPAGDVTAKATDPAGNVSEPSAPEKATADTKAPAKPEIKTDLTDKAGTKTPVEVSAEPGSKVELFDKEGNKIGEGVADENGKATITPTVELPAGDVTAKATDPVGNVSEPSAPEKATADTKAPAKPEIKTDLTDKAGTKTPVEVSAEPGSKVELFDKEGNKIGEGVADENGKATITPTVELPAGDVTAKATDPAGNVSEPSAPEKATADTKAPAKPEIKTDLTDKAGTKTPVEVSAEPGSKVELFDKEGNKIGEGVADENGKATITPTVELPAGDVTAKATDPAGNVSEPSAPEKATADTKAPAKPEIKTDLTDKAGTKTPVEVSAEPGSKVELFDKEDHKIGEGVADENGKATITPTVELPAGDVTAKATDPAGNVSEPSAPEKATADTKAPAKPEIKTDLTDKAGTKTPVEVSAEPGSKVELFDKEGHKIGEGVADENGKATITPTVELPAGDVTAKATDPAGNVSEASTPANATADTKAPAKPEIKTDLTDKAGTKTPVEVSAEPGSKVELFDKEGHKIGEGVADENGKATITPTRKLPAGDVTAKATDPAGNVSEASTPANATPDTKAPAKPEIKTDLTDKAGTKTPVEVSAEPGSKVELFDKEGHKIGEGVADENGKATITPTRKLPAGDVTAKATDPAGNVSEPSAPEKATADTKAPAKPEIKTDLTDKAGTKTPVEVSAEPGSKVELFDKEGHKIGEGVADENGKATITPTVELPAGDVTAKATDPAGNVSEPSAPEKATADTKAPAKPEIKTDLTDKAGTKTPVEVSAEPGSKVELFDKEGHKIGEGVADENGKATITPTRKLPAGDVTAKATDPAGNVSEASTPANATPDTKAPAKPEIKTDLTDKAGTKTPVEVSAEPGSKVELFDKEGHKIGEGVADENGKATITPTRKLPAGDVTAKATDPAGNVSEASTPANATADTKAPAKPEIKTDLTDKAGTKTPVEVSAEPGSKVELFDKEGHKIGEGVADENGKATITPTRKLPAGDVTAKATDPAGNVSEASTPANATADTKAPAKPEIKTDLTDKAGTKTPVEVSAEPGSKVELFDKEGHKIGEGVADENGKATITPTKKLPSGDVTAKATDPAGNVSEASTPANATPDTKAPAKPEIKTDLTDKAGTKTPVEVSAEPGSKVELFDKEGHKIGEGVADENGKATITPTRKLPAGDVTAKATDPAGNVSQPSVPAKATSDSKTPAKPESGNDINTPADKVVVKNPAKLTDDEKKAIEDKVKAANPGATVVVDDKGNATVTTPEGKSAVIPASDLMKKAEISDSSLNGERTAEQQTTAQSSTRKASTGSSQKELPNTGTSTLGTVLPAIAALLSGVGVFATKKKEDE